MDDYLFMLMAVILCMLIFFAMIAALYLEVKLMRTELNDYIFYTYQPCDCFTHKDFYPYVEHESVGDCDADSSET